MAVLERITQMKNQGLTTAQIVNSLKQEGITPKEINEALSQSEIKSEISNQPQAPNMQQSPQTMANPEAYQSFPAQQPLGQQPNQQFQGQQPMSVNASPAMQPQQMGVQNPQGTSSQGVPEIPNYASTVEAPSQAQQMNPSIMPQQDLLSQDQYQEPMDAQIQPQYQEAQLQDFQQQDAYDPGTYPEYSPAQSTDFEAINDITNQLIDEKMQNLKKDLSISIKSKEQTADKIIEIEARLEKIENTLDELQMSLIRKIGDYGENVENISKELKATQDAFSKVVDPIVDHKKETKSPSKKSTKEKKDKEKPKTSFEDYLR